MNSTQKNKVNGVARDDALGYKVNDEVREGALGYKVNDEVRQGELRSKRVRPEVEGAVKYKILFLDDDEFIRDMYSVKFSQAGHECVSVASAEDAIKELENGFEPDAILTDLIMPGIDGFAFIELLNKGGYSDNTAVIVLSNQGESEDLARAQELGATGHIIKANTIPTEVLGIVEKLISKYKNQ